MINGSLDFGLKDKVAIVAGGGSVGQEIGNGRAASILLADAGAKVLVADKEELLAKNTFQMIKDRGGEAKYISGDLTKSEECKKVVDFGLFLRREPVKAPYGITAIFEDPFGNLWDLVQRSTPERKN